MKEGESPVVPRSGEVFKPDFRAEFFDVVEMVDALLKVVNLNDRWAVTIERTTNGYKLRTTASDEDDFGPVEKIFALHPGSDEHLQECLALKGLLWDLTEYFGVYHSKHYPWNLRITVEDVEGKEYEEK